MKTFNCWFNPPYKTVQDERNTFCSHVTCYMKTSQVCLFLLQLCLPSPFFLLFSIILDTSLCFLSLGSNYSPCSDYPSPCHNPIHPGNISNILYCEVLPPLIAVSLPSRVLLVFFRCFCINLCTLVFGVYYHV